MTDNAKKTNVTILAPPQSQGGGFYRSSTTKSGRQQPPARPSSLQQLTEMKEKLGVLDKWSIGKRARVEARRVIAEIVVNALEKQKQMILFQMTIELADEKKRLFAESLREAARVEKEIAERSTQHEDALIDFVLDAALEGQQKKEHRIEHLDAQLAAGKLTRESYVQEVERVHRWSLLYLDNIDAKIELMLRNHAHLIEKALVLFNERAIPGTAI